MDERERHNWTVVMQALEEAGKTDCFFYKRAKAISRGEPDPFDTKPFETTDE